jgi:hypothetical protein
MTNRYLISGNDIFGLLNIRAAARTYTRLMPGWWMRGRQSLPPWLSTAWILSVSVLGVALGRVNGAVGLFVLLVGMPLGALLMIAVIGRRNGDRR